MKTKLVILGLLAALALPPSCSPALARPVITERSAHHHARTFRHSHHARRVVHHRHRVAHRNGIWDRPRAWCGWFARQLVGTDPGVAFNLARNWAHWGRAAAPGVGVMVVWSHHVGKITGRTADGQWIVTSGNDGHAVRTRPRSLAGAIAFRTS